MKIKILFTKLLILSSFFCFGQYPIIQNFNTINSGGTDWTGSGCIQNYSGSENYYSFNCNTTPYPNSSNINITSPTYNFTSNCVSNITITFQLQGIIENGYDFARVQYLNSLGTWVTIATFTGVQNGIFSYNTIPNTATRFRLRLSTDGSVNTYLSCCPWTTNTYYYDFAYFTIDCASPMPLEWTNIKTELDDSKVVLNWLTYSELNTDKFLIERTPDTSFYYLDDIKAASNSTRTLEYKYIDLNPLLDISYYRVTEVDNDGKQFKSNIVSIDNKPVKIDEITIYNLLGQKISNSMEGIPSGIYIVQYRASNRVITKKIVKE